MFLKFKSQTSHEQATCMRWRNDQNFPVMETLSGAYHWSDSLTSSLASVLKYSVANRTNNNHSSPTAMNGGIVSHGPATWGQRLHKPSHTIMFHLRNDSSFFFCLLMLEAQSSERARFSLVCKSLFGLFCGLVLTGAKIPTTEESKPSASNAGFRRYS